MVVLGTKAEFFNAVWVKNEWSRYLALIRKGEKKMLIPAYRDMDPYDLIRGIKKIIGESQPKNNVVQNAAVNSYSPNITALLKRGNIALEDCDWDEAKNFFDEVLNNDAECAEAYLCEWYNEYENRKSKNR